MDPRKRRILMFVFLGIVLIAVGYFAYRSYVAKKLANQAATEAQSQAQSGVTSAITGTGTTATGPNTEDTIGTPAGMAVLSNSQCNNILRAKCGKRCVINLSRRCKDIHQCWENGRTAYCGRL